VKAMCTNNEIVKFQRHIGDGRYVSVMTGFPCVDFSKFYVLYVQQEIKPTRQGIALRLNEWMEMRKTIETINYAHLTSWVLHYRAICRTIITTSCRHWNAESVIRSSV